MGKSRIKDVWLRNRQEKENKEKGRHPKAMTERPRKSVSAFIQRVLSEIKPRWMAQNTGHRRNPQGNIKVSGMVRARLKEETRREINEEL